MKNPIKKSYKFALKTTIYLCAVLGVLMTIVLLSLSAFNIWALLIFCFISFLLLFFIIQYRAERFIYRRIKKIYDDLTLLESASLRSQPITTDMATLTEEIDKFAKTKKLEIETLKVREEYRKEYLGNISHELKTPLFTVQGYILTLLDGAMENPMLLKKYLERTNKGVERLIYIVQDLDMITKLEAGDLSLHIETFNIVEVVESVFDLLEMKASRKKITLTFDLDYSQPIMVKADKERIRQVITNLVVNSIKYGRIKGTTEISIENLIKNKVIVRVTDNGEGISTTNIPRLFERFYRIDKSGSRKEGGSGLGLSIVKHVIEAHQERIYVESAINIGSEFSFTLEKAE